jgi:hypothetical protein
MLNAIKKLSRHPPQQHRARTDSAVRLHGVHGRPFPMHVYGAMGPTFRRHFVSNHLAMQNWWLQFR